MADHQTRLVNVMKQAQSQNTSSAPAQQTSTNYCVDVPSSPLSFPVDPELVKVFADNGSPILLLCLLCWFFKILTQFIEVCQQD
jgi:hypothetical protein